MAHVTTRTRTTGGTRRRGCLVGCLVILCILPAAPVGADPADDRRAEARRIAADLDAQGTSVSVLAEELDGGRLRVRDLAAEAATAERDLARAEAEAAGARAQLSAEAVDTYVQGGVDLGAAPVAAGEGDPVRRRQYAMVLQARRADVLDQARARASVVRERKERLEQARLEAERAVADVERAQREAEAAAARLEATRSRVDADLAVLVEAEQDERAATEAAEVQASLAARNPNSAVATLPPPPRPARPATAAPSVGEPPPLVPLPASPPTTTWPAPKPAPDPGPQAPAPSGGAAAAIAEAQRQLGKPYKWGGSGPDNFDCSGLTAWAWKAGGRILPHSSRSQFAMLPAVNPADARPGDLFAYGNPIHHIGIYVGGGQIIAAPQTGKTVSYGVAYRKDLTGVVRP